MAKKSSVKVLSETELRSKYAEVCLRGSDINSSLYIPSRVIPINYLLGGGLPYGKIIEAFGYESTGKSLLAYEFAHATQKLGGKVLWCDAEFSFQSDWAEKNGVNADEVDILEDQALEVFADWMRDSVIYYRSKLVNNEPILIILDSLAALECAENINADQMDSKAQMGTRAKAVYRMFRERAKLLKKYGATLYIVNQIRQKSNASMFESSTTTTGGESTKFYASQRIAFSKHSAIYGKMGKKGRFIETEYNKGDLVGRNISLKMEKNKVAPPRPGFKTQVYFLEDATGYVGFNRYMGMKDILTKLGVITAKGAWISHKGNNIAQGEGDFMAKFHSDKELRQALIEDSGINTISKTRAAIKALSGTNLYPVKLASSNDSKSREEDSNDE